MVPVFDPPRPTNEKKVATFGSLITMSMARSWWRIRSGNAVPCADSRLMRTSFASSFGMKPFGTAMKSQIVAPRTASDIIIVVRR